MMPFPQVPSHVALEEDQLSSRTSNRFKHIFDSVSAGVNANVMPVNEFVERILSFKDDSIRYDALFAFMLNVDASVLSTGAYINTINVKDTQEAFEFIELLTNVLGNMVFNPGVIRYMNRSIPQAIKPLHQLNKPRDISFHEEMQNAFVLIGIECKKIKEDSGLSEDQKKMLMKRLQPNFVSLVNLLKAKAHPTMIAIENLTF